MKLKENETIPNSEFFIMEDGNPIKKSMILKISPEVIANMILFVINQNREFLGLGFSKFNYEGITQSDNNEEIAHNLIDKGVYLRKNQ